MLALAALLTAPTQIHAQTYPNRPIRLISPFPAGGGNDVLARVIASKLGERLGGTVIVENRGGAGGVIGIQTLARATPDGYSLVLSGSTLAIAGTFYKRAPFDAIKDFVPVALVATYPFLLVSNPSLQARSVAELIARAKEKPGEILYASPGVSSSQHLFMELLKVLAGVDLRHVPYSGTAPASVDIVAGRVSLMFGAAAPTLPLVRQGSLRALGVSSAARLAEAPDIPPMAETIPGFDASNWTIVLAPAGTPPDVVRRLHAELKVVMALPEVQAQLGKVGMLPIVSPSLDELQAFVRAEVTRWGKIVQQAGIAGSL